jgi:hypothetical protein
MIGWLIRVSLSNGYCPNRIPAWLFDNTHSHLGRPTLPRLVLGPRVIIGNRRRALIAPSLAVQAKSRPAKTNTCDNRAADLAHPKKCIARFGHIVKESANPKPPLFVAPTRLASFLTSEMHCTLHVVRLRAMVQCIFYAKRRAADLDPPESFRSSSSLKSAF